MGGAPRCWFQDETKNHLIQLQADRFLRNWRQVQGTEPYPRYAKLIQEFKLEWELFCTFVQETGLGHATVNQCELTYINNILVPKPEELGKVATVFTWAAPPDPTGFLPLPETINWGA